MLLSKDLSPADLLVIVRKRFWLLILPGAVLGAVVALVAQALPDTYQSEAVVLVVPQQIPQSLVRSIATRRLDERVTSISQQILSRTRLERVIEEFDLYPADRRQGLMEDVVNRMRRDITTPVVKGDAFKVTYQGSNPRTVQQVTAAIASLFIAESLRDRAVLAEGTSQFLEVQLEDARRRLIEQEKKLEAYRMRYSGQLPTQLGGNLQALQNKQMQIQSTLESMNRDRDQKLLLSRQLADLEADGTSVDAAPTGGGAPGNATDITGGTTAQQLEQARQSLAALQLRYKPDYPDIPRLRRVIRDLEQKLEVEAVERAANNTTEAPVAVSKTEQARLKRVQDLKAQIAQIDKRIDDSQANETRLRTESTEYQSKIDSVPARESELTELTRDYGTIQNTYTSLLSKKEESNLAANLERRQIGEQFKLLDPAQLPERPISPNRPGITALGMVAGALVGLVAMVFLEYRDTSFKTDDEITTLLALPVLAVVPVMKSDREQRRDAFRRAFLGFGFGSAVLLCLAIVAYTLVR